MSELIAAADFGAIRHRMGEQQFQILRGIGLLVALVLAGLLQRASPHSGARGSTRTNFGLWLVNGAVMGVACGACACSVAQWASHHGFGLLQVISAPQWLAVPVTILGLDFVSYIWHRANHVIPTLWRFHRVHHSDITFTASTALRFHPGELLLSLPLRLGAVALLGAPAIAVVAFEIVFNLANLVEHSDTNVPATFERAVGRVLITPAVHRFHHTRAGRERDHNFGTILAVWDRVLGTHRPNASTARIEVGIPEITDRLALPAVLALPLRGPHTNSEP